MFGLFEIFKMEMSESMCLNKEILSENVNVFIGRGDNILDDFEEFEFMNVNLNEEERLGVVIESVENVDEGIRSWKLMDKGKEEKVKCLK